MRALRTVLRKNDQVQVMAGKEKGKRGRILQIVSDSPRVLVEKLNRVKVHQKPSASNRQGGIVEKESGIHLSNLLLICPKCEKPVRVGFKVTPKEKLRVCKKCGEEVRSAV